ncbi:hypothetical protein NEISICOT_02631, partial [Neisseria sicca ATCC 29256]
SRLRAAVCLKPGCSQDAFLRPTNQPPSGGCVLKQDERQDDLLQNQPAAFGRLCVETMKDLVIDFDKLASRLRAAVC